MNQPVNRNSPSCGGCGSSLPIAFLDLGMTPLVNSYLRREDLDRVEDRFPLAVAHCPSCYLVQVTNHVPPEKMFSEYLYFSSFSDSFVEHARQMADSLISAFGLDDSSRVMEIASNDGYLLRFFLARGIPVLGVEPAQNIAAAAQRQDILTLCRFFGPAVVEEVVSSFGKSDLIIGNNVLAHVPEINGFLSAVAACLKPAGAAVFEFPYVRELLDRIEFDTIYHEHVYYYSLSAVKLLAERAGLELFDVERQSVHGGSLRIFLQTPRARAITENVRKILAEEVGAGLTSAESFISFGTRVERLKASLLSMLTELKNSGKRLAAYGAPAKGNTLLNYCGIGADLLDFTVDLSPHKQGLYLPGSHLPILAPSMLLERGPEYTVILPWNIADEIIGQQREYLASGGNFILPIPEPRILSNSRLSS
jgi:SAM-dependent methyltransferase